MKYPEPVMRHELDACSEEVLTSVLITQDGQGKEIKQKILDILLKRNIEKNKLLAISS